MIFGAYSPRSSPDAYLNFFFNSVIFWIHVLFPDGKKFLDSGNKNSS